MLSLSLIRFGPSAKSKQLFKMVSDDDDEDVWTTTGKTTGKY